MRKTMLILVASAAATALLAAAAWAQDGSNFANTCDVAFHGNQDPIYEPRHGHGHIFFGARAVRNSDTGASLRGDPTSCNRETNSSAYWLPEVYRNNSAAPLPVDTESKGLGDNTIYYRAGDVADARTVQSFPSDFEVVSRDRGGPGDVKWTCDKTGRPLTEAPPETCSTKLLTVNVQFPQCWDGKQVPDSSNGPEYLRMAGADGDCDFPDGRYRAVPQITMSLNFVLPSSTVGNITVAGDDGRLPYTRMHADFVNGWSMEALNDLVADCITKVPHGTPAGQKPAKCADPDRTSR